MINGKFIVRGVMAIDQYDYGELDECIELLLDIAFLYGDINENLKKFEEYINKEVGVEYTYGYKIFENDMFFVVASQVHQEADGSWAAVDFIFFPKKIFFAKIRSQ